MDINGDLDGDTPPSKSLPVPSMAEFKQFHEVWENEVLQYRGRVMGRRKALPMTSGFYMLVTSKGYDPVRMWLTCFFADRGITMYNTYAKFYKLFLNANCVAGAHSKFSEVDIQVLYGEMK